MSTAKTTAGIRINGQTNELPFTTQQILSISVSKEVNKIPMAVITLKDGIPNMQDFPISNQDTFRPGTPIEIVMGEPAQKQSVFKGIVTKHGLQVRKDKPSILTVECKDESVRLTIGRKSRFWLDKSDSDIFKEIFQEYATFPNLQLNTEDTTGIIVHDQMTQYYSNDWDFMAMRAEALAKYIFVDDGLVRIEQPNLAQQAALSLKYGIAGDTPAQSRIWEFESEMDARYQFDKIETLGWDYAKQEVTQANPGISIGQEPGNITSKQLSEVIKLATYRLHHHARMNGKELTAFADAVKQKSVLHKIRGRVKFDGRADIKPGQLVLLEGVGDRFNGNVFVSRVFHTFQPGRWFTQIQVGLPFSWFHESEHIPNPPAQGMLPPAQGLQIGTVIQIEDKGRPSDRLDKNFRIKVKISGFHQQNEGIWARLASFYATAGQGAVFLPELNDEVVVGYVGEDSREPVILGALFSQAHNPPLANDDNNFFKGIVTKKGHKVLFNDDKDIVTIETNGGNKIVLDDGNGKIETADANGNTVVLDSNGITLKSSAKIQIEASTEIQIKGSKIALEAGMIEINHQKAGSVLLGQGVLPAARATDVSPPPSYAIVPTNTQVMI